MQKEYELSHLIIKKMNLHALQIEIMDQLGVKPWINGRYDLREVEPSDHFMFRTYRDRWIRIFTNAY